MPDTATTDSVYIWETGYGLLEIGGPDAKDLLHRLSTNDIMSLEDGISTTTIFATPKGRIIDRVRISIIEDTIYMYTSPGLAHTITEWLDSYTFMEDITVHDLTTESLIFELIGSESMEGHRYWESYGKHVSSKPYVSLDQNQVASVYAATKLLQDDNSPQYKEIATRTRGPIDPTYLIHRSRSDPFWAYHDLPSNFKWITSSNRESLRIRSGIPQSPNEINLQTNPLEVGLRSDIDFEKGCYIGQEVILRLDTYKKVKRHLVRITLETESPPKIGSNIVRSGDSVPSGKVTSISEKIEGKGFEGLALVKSAVQDFNQTFEIHQTDTTWKANLHPLSLSE